jgi:phosphate starvation-inducible membrane PsiE
VDVTVDGRHRLFLITKETMSAKKTTTSTQLAKVLANLLNAVLVELVVFLLAKTVEEESHLLFLATSSPFALMLED